MSVQYRWKLFLSKLWFWKVKAKECGHYTKTMGQIEAFGDRKIITFNGQPEYCLDCMAKMSILCAWCGQPIMVGDQITLLSPSSPEEFVIPGYAVVHSKEPLQLVGCLRWDCADSACLRAGFWDTPGKVSRCESPIEMAFRTGRAVIG